MSIFPFVQFEFTHSLGPEPGRYVIVPEPEPGEQPRAAYTSTRDVTGIESELRAKGSADVLVITTQGAPPATGRRILSRRSRVAEEGTEVQPVSLALATLIRATTELPGDSAKGWLERLRGDWEERESWVEDALWTLNEVIAAYRCAARDPYAIDLTRIDPRAIRVGYGDAKSVSEGRWQEAIIAQTPREGTRSRAERVAPSATMTSFLARRVPMLDADELLCRAVLDLDQGRPKSAALQLETALKSARWELGSHAISGPAADRIEDAERIFEAQRPEEYAKEYDPDELRSVAERLDQAIITWREAIDVANQL